MFDRVPVFEPEVIDAMARVYNGDTDKVATTSISKLVVDGVEITSRYQKAHELESLRSFVMSLTNGTKCMLKSAFCDSKAGSAFEFDLEGALMDDVVELCFDEIKTKLDQIGHNGALVRSGQFEVGYIEPYWPSDFCC